MIVGRWQRDRVARHDIDRRFRAPGDFDDGTTSYHFGFQLRVYLSRGAIEGEHNDVFLVVAELLFPDVPDLLKYYNRADDQHDGHTELAHDERLPQPYTAA